MSSWIYIINLLLDSSLLRQTQEGEEKQIIHIFLIKKIVQHVMDILNYIHRQVVPKQPVHCTGSKWHLCSSTIRCFEHRCYNERVDSVDGRIWGLPKRVQPEMMSSVVIICTHNHSHRLNPSCNSLSSNLASPPHPDGRSVKPVTRTPNVEGFVMD